MKQLSKSLIAILLFVANTCAYAGQNMRTKDSLMVVTESNDDACTSHLVRDKSGVRDTLISIYCADGSEIEPLKEVNSKNKQTQIEVFAIYNAAADGSQYVLYNHQTQRTYITFATIADFKPTSVLLKEDEKYVLLKTNNSAKAFPKETLNVGNREKYIANGSRYKVIKAGVKAIKNKP